MSETLEVGGLTFEVRRSLRRKTLGLTVDRGGELVIHAPENATDHELTRWTRAKLLWVYRTLARQEALAPKVRAPEFVSGENFSYLGRTIASRSCASQQSLCASTVRTSGWPRTPGRGGGVFSPLVYPQRTRLAERAGARLGT